jgi:amino acid permease
MRKCFVPDCRFLGLVELSTAGGFSIWVCIDHSQLTIRQIIKEINQ